MSYSSFCYAGTCVKCPTCVRCPSVRNLQLDPHRVEMVSEMALEAPFTMCDEKVAGALHASLPFFRDGDKAPVIITQVAAQLPPG